MNNDMIINAWLRSVKSPHTIRNYTRIINEFLESLGNPNLIDVTRFEILNWKQNLNGASATRAQKIACIKSVFKFMYDNDITEDNRAGKIKIDRIENKEKDALSMDEVREMMQFANPREKAILVLTTQTGLRASEVASITLDDFLNYNPESGMKIRTKGDKPRVIYLTDSTIDYICKYLPSRKCGSDKLFVSNHGTDMVEKNLNTMVQKLARKTGTDKHWTFHSLRACACVAVYEATQDIILTQHWIGHSNLSTTLRYIRRDEKLKDVTENVFAFL